MPHSTQTFTKTEHDGTKITIILKVEQDHYPTWAKWVRFYQESPVAFGLTKEE